MNILNPGDVHTITIPADRTQHQPIIGFCYNPECMVGGKRFEFSVEHEHVSCPKCGATEAPMIGLLSLIHFLVRNPKGQIKGSGGIRFSLACDEKRAYLATHTNQEAATDQLDAANCPGCLAIAKERKLAKQQGSAFKPEKE